MATTIHFIDVGQGNMVLVQCANGTNFIVDCNLTENNWNRVRNYLISQVNGLRAFICTHRDADHMRGIRALHNLFPFTEIWDSGFRGDSVDTDEYKEYIKLREELNAYAINKGFSINFGQTYLYFISAQDNRLPQNSNDQGLVIKVVQRNSATSIPSAILTGDGSRSVWQDGIMKDYTAAQVSCDVLMAAHHGSWDFFQISEQYYYDAHMRAINPYLTVVSVGPNNYGHPDPNALKLYTQFSKGMSGGAKVWRTDQQHNMKLVLQDDGKCTIYPNQ